MLLRVRPPQQRPRSILCRRARDEKSTWVLIHLAKVTETHYLKKGAERGESTRQLSPLRRHPEYPKKECRRSDQQL